jgi:hypothetical protein
MGITIILVIEIQSGIKKNNNTRKANVLRVSKGIIF